VKLSSEIYSTNEVFMVCKSILCHHALCQVAVLPFSCTDVAEVTFFPKNSIAVAVAKIPPQELMLEVITMGWGSLRWDEDTEQLST